MLLAGNADLKPLLDDHKIVIIYIASFLVHHDSWFDGPVHPSSITRCANLSHIQAASGFGIDDIRPNENARNDVGGLPLHIRVPFNTETRASQGDSHAGELVGLSRKAPRKGRWRSRLQTSFREVAARST